jgi:DNA polymerase V
MSTASITAELKKFYRQHHYLPSIRELCSLLGRGANYRTQVQRILDGLVAIRYLKKAPNGRYIPGDKFFTYQLYHSVQAGSFTPAAETFDYINLEEYLIRRPNETIIITVSGDSMIEAGINHGDLVIVEKTQKCQPGDIVVASKDGEFTVKYYQLDKQGKPYLQPANPKYGIIEFNSENQVELIGIVRKCIKNF